MIEMDCQICGKIFEKYPCRVKVNKNVFCSRQCADSHHSKSMVGDKNKAWKGDRKLEATKIGYSYLHQLIREKFGCASLFDCSLKDITCSPKKEWSNKSGKYRTEKDDWWVLCKSHHARYDMREGTKKKISKALKGRIFTKLHRKRISVARKGIIPWNKKI